MAFEENVCEWVVRRTESIVLFEYWAVHKREGLLQRLRW